MDRADVTDVHQERVIIQIDIKRKIVYKFIWMANWPLRWQFTASLDLSSFYTTSNQSKVSFMLVIARNSDDF